MVDEIRRTVLVTELMEFERGDHIKQRENKRANRQLKLDMKLLAMLLSVLLLALQS